MAIGAEYTIYIQLSKFSLKIQRQDKRSG